MRMEVVRCYYDTEWIENTEKMGHRDTETQRNANGEIAAHAECERRSVRRHARATPPDRGVSASRCLRG